MKTVRVPNAIAGPFAEAEEIVSKYFRDRRDDPTRGTIEIFGERYLLLRAASLSVEFFRVVYDLYGPGREREAEEFARNILFDLAHAIGKSDALNFHAKMGLVDPIARLSAGPVHFAHAGWAFVDISGESSPTPDEHFRLIYDHPYSFEADAWLRAERRTDFGACIMNAGYSSGWCSESFGIALVAAEVECRARGEAHCRFVMAPPEKIEALLERTVGGDGRHLVPDFFARKRMEEELRRARDQLELRVSERTLELRSANERLRDELQERELMERKLAQAQRLESIGRLAGGVAHDFNNLMAVILGNAGLALKTLPENSATRAFLVEIRDAGERAAELTRQLLAFGRVQPRGREVLEMDEVVRELVRLLDRLIGADIQLVLELGAEPRTVAGDRAQLEQVVVNLVVNARDAMPHGGTLTVTVTEVELDAAVAETLSVEPGRYVELTVRDTGVGMSEEVAARVFDPYFTTKESGKGTGLGLSTVYGIVRQAGGTVTVSSEIGHGSSFRVLLPAVTGQISSRLLPARNVAADGGSEAILLVEDEPSLRVVVARILEGAGYHVTAVGDPIEAARFAEERGTTIDLLLTDVVLPGMTGPELALRLVTARPELRVLYMSGYAGGIGSGEGQLDIDLLNKPFAPEDLILRVRRVLDRDS
jgi:signal transduction histidine kinase/CheY-like chemotaxis protein